MYSANKRKVTISILVLAGLAVLIALLLAGPAEDDGVSASASVAAPALTPPAPVPPPAPTPPATPPVVDRLPPTPPAPPKPAAPPQVDVVFALDTTGSMGGLIEGAKRKIWAIANQVLAGQPKPEVRIGLIGYRDLGDEYVTRRYPLTENIDDVYSRLQSFRAEGGGDTPEHVNRAIADALRKMQWRSGPNVLKLIFLVGDAPSHDGQEGLYLSALAAEARRKGIVINTVRCGSAYDTEQEWQRYASLTGGMYSSVRQDGAMVAVRTPLDERLRDLNERLSRTAIPVGSAGEREESARRLRVNASMDGWAQAESAKFRGRSGKIDSNDLLGKGGDVEKVKDADLPAPLAAMAKPARKAYVAAQAKARAELQSEIDKVSKERDRIIRAKRPATSGMDDALGAALKKQGAKAGITY
jgi:hypothetical protein